MDLLGAKRGYRTNQGKRRCLRVSHRAMSRVQPLQPSQLLDDGAVDVGLFIQVLTSASAPAAQKKKEDYVRLLRKWRV